MDYQRKRQTGQARCFGRNVALWRRSLGLSQQALADAAGMSRPTLGNIEIGVQGVRLSTALDIAAALGAPLSVLVGEQGCATCKGLRHPR